MRNKIKPERILAGTMLVILGAICSYVFPPLLLVGLILFLSYVAFRG